MKVLKLTLTFLGILFYIFAAGQVTYVVNTTDDVDDGVCDGVHCSLREAISTANGDGVPSYINFNITGTAPHTILLTSDLPTLSENFTTIDGTTQPGNNPFNKAIEIGYDPISIDFYQATFVFTGSNCQIKGLALEGLNGSLITNYGFIESYSDFNLIQNNYFVKSDGIEGSIFINDNTVLENNYFNDNSYPLHSVNVNGNNNFIRNNYFGYIDSTTLGISYVASNIGLVSSGNTIEFNRFYSGSAHIESYGLGGNVIHDNIFECASEIFMSGNVSGFFPNITSIDDLYINGVGDNTFQPDNYIIYIYSTTRDEDPCEGYCDASTYLGQVTSDTNGNWSFPLPIGATSGDSFLVYAENTAGEISDFSSCYTVLPDFCGLSELLPVNTQPCSTTGIVLDLKELTDSQQGLLSTCTGTYVDNDAWYQIEVPSTGNFLVRANLNNTVVPVIEAYTGDCDGLFSAQACAILDSVPYAMVFENYIPNSTVYLRVWDKDNTITASANTALLHLTAHELPLDNDNWQICDQENSLINGNPTILSERDANSFIIQYEPTATPAEIAADRAFFISEGAQLEDECICNSVALELWGSDNPIDMEERRQSAKNRASVDTSSYNYIFETIEFQVNAYAIGMQYATDVAMDDEGNFALTWVDQQRRHNYGRVYRSSGNPITQEFQIGTTNKTQFEPSLAMQSNGDFVTVWHEIDEAVAGATFSIWGRQYDSAGDPKGQAFDISTIAAQNISTSQDTLSKYAYGANAEVAIANNGDFAVVWHVGGRVFVQRYDSNAALQGQIITVQQGAAFNPHPAIVMDATGNFIITWSSSDTTNYNGIFMRRYDANGNPLGSVVQVNSTTTGEQSSPDIAMTDTGEFIIVWESENQDGDDFGVFAQRYDALGNPVGGEFQVNTNSVAAQRHPSVSMLNDGTFMVAWSSYINGVTLEDIYAQIFASNGTPINSEFQVNTFDEPEQEKPKTATNGSTIFIASWEDGANDGSFTGIFGQRYEVLDIAGNKIVYPIGTATPSTLLGQELAFPATTYQPTDSVSNVRVAIIDTGIDPSNPYLVNAMWDNQEIIDSDNCYTNDDNGYDFINETGSVIDFDGHGTKVNGIVTRDFDPNIQLEMMNIKFHELNQGKVFDAICGIYYAVDNGADMLNLSWGFEASEYPLILRDALQYASDNDVLIVTTAGNTSKNNDLINKFPCNLDIPNMIVVTSYGVDGQTGEVELANYASYGANNVDIAAYGYVETPELGGAIGKSAGTSLAAPAVTRTAATIKGLFPSLSAADIKNCILSTAEYANKLDGLVLTNGILDHNAAIECARQLAGNCVAIDLYISNPQNIDSTYRSDAYIGSDATLSNTVDVEYLAADSIMLNSDFCVPIGAEFLADIDDCDPLNNITGTENEEVFRIQEHSLNSGKIKAQFQAKTGEQVTIRFLNNNKKLLDEWQVTIPENGDFEKIINVHRLPTGLYYVEYSNGDWLIEKAVQVE